MGRAARDDDRSPFPPLQRLADALEAVAALPVVDRAQQLARAKRCLRALLAERRWLDRHCRDHAPLPRDVNDMLILHAAPRFTILAGCFVPRYRTGIHDHKTWGLIGTWAGQEIEQRFRIAEQADGRVRLVATRGAANGPGDISVLIPRLDEIHMVGNVAARPAFSVHVYGYGPDHRPGRSTWYGRPDADGWAAVLPD